MAKRWGICHLLYYVCVCVCGRIWEYILDGKMEWIEWRRTDDCALSNSFNRNVRAREKETNGCVDVLDGIVKKPYAYDTRPKNFIIIIIINNSSILIIIIITKRFSLIFLFSNLTFFILFCSAFVSILNITLVLHMK